MDICTKINHPTHGIGSIVGRVDEFTVIVKYDKITSWGNPVEQSECDLEEVVEERFICKECGGEYTEEDRYECQECGRSVCYYCACHLGRVGGNLTICSDC